MAEGRRVQHVIRGVDAWTVMRFSLLFYSSMLIIFLVTGTLLWTAASAVGAVHSVEKLVKDYFALASFQIEAWTAGSVAAFSAETR